MPMAEDFVIKPGVSVWSKATKKGPFITISPTELEVGLDTDNLNQIARVSGWIVRNSEGKDQVFPDAELTRMSRSEPEEIFSAIHIATNGFDNELSGYSVILLVIIWIALTIITPLCILSAR